MLPDFNGNRSPLADPNKRGIIEGLGLDASFDALVRLYYASAVGIALGTRHITEALDAAGYSIGTVHLAGGHAGSDLLPQLYADATGCSVVVHLGVDSILVGTACVAATAAGIYPCLEESVSGMTTSEVRLAPRPQSQRHLESEYGQFLRLSGLLE